MSVCLSVCSAQPRRARRTSTDERAVPAAALEGELLQASKRLKFAHWRAAGGRRATGGQRHGRLVARPHRSPREPTPCGPRPGAGPWRAARARAACGRAAGQHPPRRGVGGGGRGLWRGAARGRQGGRAVRAVSGVSGEVVRRRGACEGGPPRGACARSRVRACGAAARLGPLCLRCPTITYVARGWRYWGGVRPVRFHG